MNTISADMVMVSSWGAGALCSAASTLSYAQGSWAGAFGTLAVSAVTITGSLLGCSWLEFLLEGRLFPDEREFLRKNEPLMSVVTCVTIVAVNALALSAIMWTGLPIAPLSFQAKIGSGVAMLAPAITGMVIARVIRAINTETSPTS